MATEASRSGPLAELARLLDELARVSGSLAEQRELIANLNCIVLRWDPDGRIVYLNPYGEDFFGYALAEVRGRSVLGTIVPRTETSGRDLATLIQDILLHPERYLSNENENIRRDGERVWVTWRNRPVLDARGRLTEIVSTGIDTTTRKRAEEALRESELRYRILFQSTPVALLEGDASALKTHLDAELAAGRDLDALARDPGALARGLGLIRATDWNTALVELLEARDDQALDAVQALAGALAGGRAGPEILRAIAAGRVASVERETSVVTLRGHHRTVVLQATVVPGHETNLSRLVLAVVDVTARKEAEEALRASAETFQSLAIHDDLTGLYNTRYLYERLGRLTEEVRATGGRFSVLFMDLDRFKQVVDRHGHLNGSRVIQEVAETIRGALPPQAFAVAYAGDEFVVVLPGFGIGDAVAAAEAIRTRVAHTGYLGAVGHTVSLTASVGVATFPEHGADVQGILGAADRALFTVKGSGRNAVARAR